MIGMETMTYLCRWVSIVVLLMEYYDGYLRRSSLSKSAWSSLAES